MARSFGAAVRLVSTFVSLACRAVQLVTTIVTTSNMNTCKTQEYDALVDLEKVTPPFHETVNQPETAKSDFKSQAPGKRFSTVTFRHTRYRGPGVNFTKFHCQLRNRRNSAVSHDLIEKSEYEKKTRSLSNTKGF